MGDDKVRLDRLLSNLGYCSRREVTKLIHQGVVTTAGLTTLKKDTHVAPSEVMFAGKPLDPGQGICILLHKPVGYTCSHKEGGALIYELLPERLSKRSPVLTSVGRLDKESSGLLLLTDDGALLHKITSPKSHVAKVYEVTLARPLRGDEQEIFSSGTLLLEGEETPLSPAAFVRVDDTHCQVTIHEGRYHQIRRMFAALENHVVGLHRSAVGKLTLGGLDIGSYRFLEREETEKIFK